MDSEQQTQAGEAYAYRPSVLGSPVEFRLTDAGLEWRLGYRSGCVPYDRLRRLRLSFRPATMQSYRFIAEIWPTEGPKLVVASTSWRSLVEQQRQDEPYRAFIRELHRRLAAAGSRARFEAGSPPLLYWPGVAVYLAVTLTLAGLTVKALYSGIMLVAAVIGAFFVLFAWQLGGFFRRNRPGTYSPDAVPPAVLPGG